MTPSKDSVPLIDLLAAHAPSRHDVESAVVEVLRKGIYLGGGETFALEQELSEKDAMAHCVGVSSGTEALRLTLLALTALFPKRTEVITVANSAPPTAQAVWLAGLTPVFVDVDPITGLMDLDEARKAVTRRTLALLPVHLYGNELEIEGWWNVPAIVEDCAHAHGLEAVRDCRNTMIRVRCWSNYPTKVLAACGDAGAVVTNSQDVAALVRRLSSHDLDSDRRPQSICGNSRMDEIQAAILRARLPHLKSTIDERRTLMRTYIKELPESTTVLTDPRGSAHLMVILVANRKRFVSSLRLRGISTGVHYAHPAHRWPIARDLPFRTIGKLPKTSYLCKRVVSLPFWPFMDDKVLERVFSAVKTAKGCLTR